jgi:RND superfamily putative drug exporter
MAAQAGDGAGQAGDGDGHARRDRAAVAWPWRAFAFVVVAGRWLILLAWIGAAVAATVYLPPLTASSAIGGLIPQNAPALRAEYDAARLFGLPLTAQAAVVQRDPHRFTLRAQAAAARQAALVDQRHGAGIAGLAAAVPIANTAGAFPGSRERSTTIITYLFFRPGTPTGAQTAGGEAYAHRYAAEHLVGVTGAAPAQDAQGALILRYLPWVELATLVAIALIVGVHFRAPGAPLATLLCVAVAYLVSVRVVALVARHTGATVPPDLEPVLAVLLLGVTTDYSVFYLAGMRSRLAEGLTRMQAARRTTAEFTPIILTAGLLVAGGIASLTIASVGPLAAFGPALALTVVTAMAVAITLAPALIAIFGGLLFRPGPARPREEAAGPASAWRDWAARLATARPVALVVVAACVAGLVAAGLGLRHIRVGFPLIRALPASAEAHRAEAAASQGFVPGILSPTEVLVLGPGVTRQRAELARLQHALASQPGVAGVVGPASLPPLHLPAGQQAPGQQAALQEGLRVVLAPSGGAARYAVIERTDPLGATAIDRIRQLRKDLPALARAAGLRNARVEVGGETALVGEAIDSALRDLSRVALVIGLVILVLLGLFLRAFLAPVYLLAASVLALAAALGLTVWIFQDVLRYGSLVYYVPFVVAVLLVSLGSDYNVFVVGRIFQEARRRPLRGAVAVAVPRASRAITTAGLALAAGFGLLALVPLAQFREIAVAMALGIVIDTFVVRSLLVPALVVLFGRAGSWPGRTARQPVRPAGGTRAARGPMSGRANAGERETA